MRLNIVLFKKSPISEWLGLLQAQRQLMDLIRLAASPNAMIHTHNLIHFLIQHCTNTISHVVFRPL